MAYKVKQRSERTDKVPLSVAGRSWRAIARRITREEEGELMEAALTQVLGRRGEMEDRVDPKRYSLLFCRAAVVGWEDLTLDVVDALVELEAEDRERLASRAGADGSLPFDPELAETFWFSAQPELFADPIYRHCKRILELEALRREGDRKNSLGSSAN